MLVLAARMFSPCILISSARSESQVGLLLNPSKGNKGNVVAWEGSGTMQRNSHLLTTATFHLCVCGGGGEEFHLEEELSGEWQHLFI